MGSKVEPYFILTAEKLTNPKDIVKLEGEGLHHKRLHDIDPPNTPAPSGVSANYVPKFEIFGRKIRKRRKQVVKYKIPVREVRQKDSMNKRMEMIKEKLEQSRERFNEQKQKTGDADLKCEPSGQSFDDDGMAAIKYDRSISDMSPMAFDRRKNDGSGNSPYVYFVVSEERLKEPTLITESGERIMSRSADKRRRVRIVEENRLKRDRKEQQSQSEKMRTLAREIGLKSDPVLKTNSESSSSSKPQPSLNTIVFPGPDYETVRPQTKEHSKSSRVIHSPTRYIPGTPANTIHSDFRIDQTIIDVDDTVPRKPFSSSPMYNGKIKGIHSLSHNHFELPNISADQKRRALGLGMSMSMKFDDFAYPKSAQSAHRPRKVSFADPLPVIRGSGFVLSTGENRDGHGMDMPPSLGPRAVTMGSITLPSEQVDKQSMCHKFLAGENISAARTRKFGIPLPLPKIDIVSNVYDEMIIKMIHEYLQDSNTPSRQSQLAKELLVHLQKHNEHMKELNVPNLDKTRLRLSKADMTKHQRKAQKLMQDMEFAGPPPNTAEELKPKPLTPLNKERSITIPETKEEAEGETPPVIQKSIPFVQITFKSRKDGTMEGMNGLSPDDANIHTDENSKGSPVEKKKDKPILTAVTPVSFQMVPPGLSKDDSFVSVSLKT